MACCIAPFSDRLWAAPSSVEPQYLIYEGVKFQWLRG